MAILISIQPQHSENVISGKKTGELRKTKPTCKLPCKVYIYETKKRVCLCKAFDNYAYTLIG